MDGDRYEKYIQAVLEKVPEAECWTESLFESFRQFEEEYYIPPSDAVRSVIRFAKKLIEPQEREALPCDEEPENMAHKKDIIEWIMSRLEGVPDDATMHVNIALSYEKDGAWYDV